MNRKAAAYAKRRYRELIPLIRQAARPGCQLCVDHFPVTLAELQELDRSFKYRLPPAARERFGQELSERMERVFAELRDFKLGGRLDPERLDRFLALGELLESEGFEVSWWDIDPNNPPNLTEADLRALNFERAGVPREGAFLVICFDIEA